MYYIYINLSIIFEVKKNRPRKKINVFLVYKKKYFKTKVKKTMTSPFFFNPQQKKNNTSKKGVYNTVISRKKTSPFNGVKKGTVYSNFY